MSCYFYVLQSQKDRSYYTGVSKDPNERLNKHNRPHKGYTARKQPWVLVAIKSFETRGDAMIYEKWVKRNKSVSVIEEVIKENGI